MNSFLKVKKALSKYYRERIMFGSKYYGFYTIKEKNVSKYNHKYEIEREHFLYQIKNLNPFHS